MVGRNVWRPLVLVSLLALAGLPAGAGPADLHRWTVIVSESPEIGADFGHDFAIDGDWMVVGAPNEDAGAKDGAVYFLLDTGDGWRQRQHIVLEDPSASFGHSVVIDDGWAAVAAPYEDSGTVHMFRLQGGTWIASGVLQASGPSRFGWDLAMDGNRLLVGAPGAESLSPFSPSGVVHLYERSGGSWSKAGDVTRGGLGSSNQFGASVGLDGDHVIIGAPARYLEEEINPGAVWFFDLAGRTFTERGRHVAGSGFDLYGDFGGVVAVEGNTAVVTDNPYGIGFDADDPGDLFFYERRGSQWVEVTALYVRGSSLDISDGMVSVGTWYDAVIFFQRGATGWEDVGAVGSHYSSEIGSAVQWHEGRFYAGAPGHDEPHSNAGAVYGYLDNLPPIARAGADIEVVDLDDDHLAPVFLNGTASEDPDGEIVSYEWRDGDEVLATGAEATVSLPVGRHILDLWVKDDAGLVDRDRIRVRVLDGPDAEAAFTFSPSRPEVGQWVEFHDESTHPTSPLMRWDWDFDGDGISDATGHAPGHAFETSGPHKVTLTVGTDNGDVLAITRTVQVQNAAPDAVAGEDVIVADDDADGLHRVDLDGSASSDADGQVTRYRWTLGGVLRGTDAKLSIDLEVGHHVLELQVTDDDGRRDTDDVVVLVEPHRREQANATKFRPEGPDAAFDWRPTQEVHPHRGVAFTDASVDPETDVIMWAWDFGDGTTSTERNPTHVYQAYGTFLVKLEVTDTDGNSGGTTKEVLLVNEPPTVAFTPDELLAVPLDRPVVFFDQSEDPEDMVTRWRWDFGDGTTSERQDVGHRYLEPGNYTVSLTIEDDGGLSQVLEGLVEVAAPWRNTTERNWTQDDASAALANGTVLVENGTQSVEEYAERFNRTEEQRGNDDQEASGASKALAKSLDVVAERPLVPIIAGGVLAAFLLILLVARRRRRR